MKKIVFAIAALLMSLSTYSDPVSDQAKKMLPEIREWLASPVVINAIKEQNKNHTALTSKEVINLDQQWRAELALDDRPLINSLTNNELSGYLGNVAKNSKGAYKEIFVMDNKGLNVGQSAVTSDYWQGDEKKWRDTYLVGPEAVVIEDVGFDESTKSHQAQLSLSIVDPETQKVIGAATVGVSVNTLIGQL